MIIYQHIAALFQYPGLPVEKNCAFIQDYLIKHQPQEAEVFQTIALHFTNKTLSEQQEYYIRTFDVNATCYLDIGYVIFGEDTKRGQMLLEMKREQDLAGNDCGTEFADHLPNVLNLLPKISDTEFCRELTMSLLMPAIKVMVENFKTENNIYKLLLNLLQDLLLHKYPDVSYEVIEQLSFKNTCYEHHGCSTNYKSLKN